MEREIRVATIQREDHEHLSIMAKLTQMDDSTTRQNLSRFAVRLDPQHPGIVYSRARVRFSKTKDMFFEQVPEAVKNDPWLMVTPVEPGAAPVFSSHARHAKQAQRLI